jgi:sec-independent protein translocase protein TatA
MGLSFFHLLVVLIVVLIVFGAGRLPHVMGDLGKGIRAFKDGLQGDPPPSTPSREVPPAIEADKNQKPPEA